MEIIVGKNSGFCYGVKNAVLHTKELLKKEKKLYCLGEIVHNANVVKELEASGLNIINQIEDAQNQVIIRAHGIPKETYKKAKDLNIKLIDYTCPNVLKIHKLAEDYEQKGFYIFLVGIKTHPETIGTISYCGNNSSLIESIDDIENAVAKFQKTNIKKLLILVQTTFSLEKFNIFVNEIKTQLNDTDIDIQIKNTICNVTRIRQQEAYEISKNVEYMIIIGGKNSSNTKKLYDISKENCTNSVMVENKNELDFKEIKKYNKIGILAGASTPQECIDEIVSSLS